MPGQHAVIQQHSRRTMPSIDRRPERGMCRFESSTQYHRPLSVDAAIQNLFNLGRDLVLAKNFRDFRLRAFASWGVDK